jgi:hypothetical protein
MTVSNSEKRALKALGLSTLNLKDANPYRSPIIESKTQEILEIIDFVLKKVNQYFLSFGENASLSFTLNERDIIS